MAKIPLKSREELPPDKRHVYDGITSTRGKILNLFKVLLSSPDAAEAVGALGAYLRYHSSLDPAAREIAILTTAKELNVLYEWAHHEPIAREVGVPDAVIEAIRSGRAPMGIPAKEGVFAQAAKELLREGALTDRTFQAIEHLVGPAGIVDLVVLVGHYATIGGVLRTFEVEVDEGTPVSPGWPGT